MEQSKSGRIASGKILYTFKGHHQDNKRLPIKVQFAKVTPDGKRVISNTGYILRMWDISSGKILQTIEGLPAYPGETRPVECTAITPDGKQAIVGAYRTIKVWDIAKGKLVQLFNIDDFVSCMALTPDGKQVVTGSYKHTLKIWDVASGNLRQMLEGHSQNIVCIKITQDRKQIVSCAKDHTVIIWDFKTGKRIASYYFSSQPINLAISSDNQTLFVGCQSGSLHKLTRVDPIKD